VAGIAGALLLSGCGAATTSASGGHSTSGRSTTAAATAGTATAAAGAPAQARQAAAAPVVRTRAAAPPTPCATNNRRQFVYVSIAQQRMWLCAKRQVALTTAVTTGISGSDTSTPTGTFHIQGRNRNSVLTLNTGKQYDVKYWIPFSAPLFGFHDSSWQDFPYGSPQYKTEGSHGCVHMPLQAIAFFYTWVHIGATVQIHA
jgi:lipoprotein-anchoring transpeptidase ErfK/SrfK